MLSSSFAFLNNSDNFYGFDEEEEKIYKKYFKGLELPKDQLKLEKENKKLKFKKREELKRKLKTNLITTTKKRKDTIFDLTKEEDELIDEISTDTTTINKELISILNEEDDNNNEEFIQEYKNQPMTIVDQFYQDLTSDSSRQNKNNLNTITASTNNTTNNTINNQTIIITTNNNNKNIKSNLENVINKLNSNKKTTISQSKEDWKEFKEKEGITNELNQYIKSNDQFTEKISFLERTDLREFERDKLLRNKERERKELKQSSQK
ncbi:hypothetical protein ABK040_013983 [Willaertia magna]